VDALQSNSPGVRRPGIREPYDHVHSNFQSGNGRAREKEVSEYSVFDDIDRTGFHAFIIIKVVAVEVRSHNFLSGWIVDDGNEVGQNRFANLFGESLAFVFILLALAFNAMSEDFVEENSRQLGQRVLQGP
jgi:hypothetical protein